MKLDALTTVEGTLTREPFIGAKIIYTTVERGSDPLEVCVFNRNAELRKAFIDGAYRQGETVRIVGTIETNPANGKPRIVAESITSAEKDVKLKVEDEGLKGTEALYAAVRRDWSTSPLELAQGLGWVDVTDQLPKLSNKLRALVPPGAVGLEDCHTFNADGGGFMPLNL